MKTASPLCKFSVWRTERLFNIDFAAYTLQHHRFPRHFHDHFVIELVIQGTDEFYCESKTYSALPGQLVLINPGEIHTGSTIGRQDLRYFSCYPTVTALQQVAFNLGIKLPADFRFFPVIREDPEPATRMLAFFNSLLKKDEPVKQQELFLEFMGELLAGTGGTKEDPCKHTGKDSRVTLLKEFIRSGFKEELSLEQMAAQVNLNPFHMARLFKRRTGISPYHYLLNVRTEYAKKLLRNGAKVNEAALEAGFYDTSHLHRLLRKFAAISPKYLLSSKGQFCTNFTD